MGSFNSAINKYENGISQKELTKKIRVSLIQVLRWFESKKNIKKDTASAHRNLFRKRDRVTRHIYFWKKKFKEFMNARSKGHVAHFTCLRAKAQKIDPPVEIKHYVILEFLQGN